MNSSPKALVVVPLSKLTYRFGMSAPLGYMFSSVADQVHGVFSYELNPGLIKSFQLFIVELNWVTELFEFRMIVRAIKRHNPKSQILFGGLFSQLHYKRIFKTCDVDLTIRGDAELPVTALISGERWSTIPNLVTRDHEAEITYRFSRSQYESVQYNLNWFPTYREMIRNHLAGKPLIHGALTPDEINYAFPIVITAKRCEVAHRGCDYCMGSHDFEFQNRSAMDSNSLISVLRNLEAKNEPEFSKVCLYILSDIENYDFEGQRFQMDVFIEYDGPIDTPKRVDRLQTLFHAFTGGECRIPASSDGIHCRERNLDYRGLVEKLQTQSHRVRFLLYQKDENWAKVSGLRETYACRHLDTFDYFGKLGFDTYSDFNRSIAISADMYAASRIDGLVELRAKLQM